MNAVRCRSGGEQHCCGCMVSLMPLDGVKQPSGAGADPAASACPGIPPVLLAEPWDTTDLCGEFPPATHPLAFAAAALGGSGDRNNKRNLNFCH